MCCAQMPSLVWLYIVMVIDVATYRGYMYMLNKILTCCGDLFH